MELKDRKFIKNTASLQKFEDGDEGWLPSYMVNGTSYTNSRLNAIQNSMLYKQNSINPTYNPFSSTTMGKYNINTDTFEGGLNTDLGDLVVQGNRRFRLPNVTPLQFNTAPSLPSIKINTQPDQALSDAGAAGVKHQAPHGTDTGLKDAKLSKANAVAGKVLGVAQGAMGGISLINQISEGSKARINPEEMLMKYGTSNSNIGDGISYERQNNIDVNSEMDQVKAETNQAALGTAMTGMSAGGAIGSVLGPVGGAVGAVAGGLIGGIAGLFSGKSRRKAEEERLRRANEMAVAKTNQNRSLAFTEKIRKKVNQKYGNQEDELLYAAKGKDAVDPITNQTYKSFIVDTAFGKQFMPQNAWGSKGEWIESGATGDLHKISHGKNDTARIHVDDDDTIYSAKLDNPITGNKIANDVPAYAAAGKLDELKMIQRNQRYNKASLRRLPGFARGAEWLSNAIPALTGLGIGLQQYNQAANQDVYKPNSFKQNQYLGSLNDLDKLHIDQFPILQQLRNAEVRNVRALFNSGGLSTGQRATNLIAAQNNTQNNIASALANYQQINNNYRAQAAKARLEAGQQEAQRRQQAMQWDADVYAKGHAARQQGMQMGLYNMQNALEQYIANEFKRKQGNEILKLYKEDQKYDKDYLKFLSGVRTKDDIYYNYFKPYDTFSNITDNTLVSKLQQDEDVKRISRDNSELSALQNEEEKALYEASKTFRRKIKRRRR